MSKKKAEAPEVSLLVAIVAMKFFRWEINTLSCDTIRDLANDQFDKPKMRFTKRQLIAVKKRVEVLISNPEFYPEQHFQMVRRMYVRLRGTLIEQLLLDESELEGQI